MLDKFLEVAMGHEKVASDQQKLVDAMTQLPVEDLVDIASGKSKLAYFEDPSGKWLEKFKGTPLMDQAIGLEQEALQIQMADNQKRRERKEMWDDQDNARDELCVKKRMLDLELAKLQSQSPEVGEEEEEEGDEVEIEAPADAVEVKEARTLRDVEQSTVEKFRQAGGRAGAKAGRRHVGKRGLGYGALGGATAGAVKGKGGLKGRALSAALGAAAGGAAGGATGAGIGHVKGKKKGKAYGEAVGKMVNVRRRQYLRDRMRQAAQSAKKDKKGKEKTSSVEEQLKMAETMGRELAQKDFEKRAKEEESKKAPLEKDAYLITGPVSAYLGYEKGKKQDEGGEGAIRGAAGWIGGSALGGAAGRAVGKRIGSPALPLAGALAGGLGGYKKLTEKYDKSGGKEETKESSVHLESAKMKLAAGAMIDDLTELEKEAVGPVLQAMKAGLKGVGQFAGKAAPRMATAVQKGGLQGGMTAGKRIGRQGLEQAAQFTKKNPLAGLGLAAGGGALGGAAVS